MPPTPVVTDRTDPIDGSPVRVWELLSDVSAYPSFWPWLRSFDGVRLAAGEEWHGAISVLGPFRLRVTITLTEVSPGRSVAARLSGDLSGTARISLAPGALHLTATLVPERRSLRWLTRGARPLAQASHDRVISRALVQLAAHLS